ncbi:GlxA family transcriptional regulator [Streptomyces sp. NPDC055025]
MSSPHTVVVLTLPSALLLDIAAPAQVFGQLGGDRYRFELAGLRKGRVRTSTGAEVVVKRGLEALQDADTIVIPGLGEYSTLRFPQVSAALGKAYHRGVRILSICTGAFVLAEAGFLDGRRATTHWSAAGELGVRYPRIEVDASVLYVDEGQIMTSAGVAAGLDLCLHVVRTDHGPAVAADVARWTVTAPFREGGQAQYIPLPSHGTLNSSPENRIQVSRDWALSRLGEPIKVEDLAGQAGMSRRTFARRFRDETGVTPIQWLLEQRLRAAQSLLETTGDAIPDVALRTGFGSAAALRTHFTRRLHTSPTAYRRAFTQPVK